MSGVRVDRPHGLAGARPGSAAQPTPLPGRDPGLGHIFCNMRSALRLPRDAIARRLATNASVIEDLETGAVSSLPHWPETARIVRGYCELLRLDPEPLLWRINRELQAIGGVEEPPTRGTRPPGPPPLLLRNKSKGRQATSESRAPHRRRRARRLFAIGAPVGVIAGLMYVAMSAPEPVYRAISVLPSPIAGPARAGMDNLMLFSAPRREGLRWIDVGDPQLRKVDKLQTTSR
jgi:hypothetical protein